VDGLCPLRGPTASHEARNRIDSIHRQRKREAKVCFLLKARFVSLRKQAIAQACAFASPFHGSKSEIEIYQQTLARWLRADLLPSAEPSDLAMNELSQQKSVQLKFDKLLPQSSV